VNLSECYGFKMNSQGKVALNCGPDFIALWDKRFYPFDWENGLHLFKLLPLLEKEDQTGQDYLEFDWLENFLFLVLKYKTKPVMYYFLFQFPKNAPASFSLVKHARIDLAKENIGISFKNHMQVTARLKYSYENDKHTLAIIFIVFDQFNYFTNALAQPSSLKLLIFHISVTQASSATPSLFAVDWREFDLALGLESQFITDIRVTRENIYNVTSFFEGKLFLFISVIDAKQTGVKILYTHFNMDQESAVLSMGICGTIADMKFGYFYTRNNFAEQFRWYGLHDNCLVSKSRCRIKVIEIQLLNNLYFIPQAIYTLDLAHVVQNIEFGWKHIILSYTEDAEIFDVKNKDKIKGFMLFNTHSKKIDITYKEPKYSKFYLVDNCVISTTYGEENYSQIISFSKFVLKLKALPDCKTASQNEIKKITIDKATIDTEAVIQVKYRKVLSPYESVDNPEAFFENTFELKYPYTTVLRHYKHNDQCNMNMLTDVSLQTDKSPTNNQTVANVDQ
jgi:hypothetical protein